MKAVVAVLGVGVVGVGVVAGVLWRDLNDVRVQNGQLRDRVISLQSAQMAASMAPAPMPQAALAPGLAAEGQAGSVEQLAAKAAAIPASDKEKKGDALMAGISKLMSTPEGKDMMVGQLRMMLPQMYPDVAKELGLSKAEEEKFMDLLARQQADLSGNALGVLTGENVDPAARQEMQRKIREQQQAQQAELNAMLGTKAPQWQDYQKTLPLRRQVNTLQGTLGDNPLSASQSKALITTLAAEQTRIQEDRRNAPRQAPVAGQNVMEMQLARETEDNARLVNAASTQLNPQQLESYKKMIQQQTETGRKLIQAIQAQQGQ